MREEQHWRTLQLPLKGAHAAYGNVQLFGETSPSLLKTYFSEAEQKYAKKFTHPQARKNHLHARIILKELLKKIGDYQPLDYEIKNNALGAPEIISSDQVKLPTHISISHTDQGALIIASDLAPVGCDLAKNSGKQLPVIQKFSQSRGISLCTITDLTAEASALCQWSVWEACSKVNQQGFRGGFHSFEVQSASFDQRTEWWQIAFKNNDSGLQCWSQETEIGWISLCGRQG